MGQRQGPRAHGGHQALEALGACRVEQEAGKGKVVLDDQQHQVALDDQVAVVVGFVERRRIVILNHDGIVDPRQRRSLDAGYAQVSPSGFAGHTARCARRRVHQWQEQREGAALAGHARQADLATEQLGQLAADRQSKPRPAVLAAGGPVGLLEGLEDDLLLVTGDADAGVRHGKSDHLLAAVELLVVRAPAGGGFLHGQRDMALVGELEGV